MKDEMNFHKSDEKVECVFVWCKECLQETLISVNNVVARYGLEYFCHDKDCEDRYALKL